MSNQARLLGISREALAAADADTLVGVLRELVELVNAGQVSPGDLFAVQERIGEVTALIFGEAVGPAEDFGEGGQKKSRNRE